MVVEQRIHAVVVDAVKVCFDDGQEKALPQLESLLNSQESKTAPPTITASEIRTALGGELRRLYSTDQLTPENYWRAFIEALPTPPVYLRTKLAAISGRKEEEIGYKEIAEELEAIILAGYKPIAPVIDLLRRLESVDYKLGMISNTTRERATAWQKNDFFKYFKGNVIFSFSPPGSPVGLRKPDALPLFLKAMALDMRLPLDSLVYVDDKSDNNNAAIEAGVGGAILIMPDNYDASASTAQHGYKNLVTATTGTLEAVLKEQFGLKFPAIISD